MKRWIRRFLGKSHKVEDRSVLPPSWRAYSAYIEVHPTAIIDPSSTLKIFNLPPVPKIMVRIGANSHIFGHLSILRCEGEISIGERCQIGNSHFICADKIWIGNDLLMAWNVVLMDNDAHSLSWEHRKNDVRQCYEDYQADPRNFIKNKDWTHVSMNPIVIQNRAWIGFNSIVLKGVRVGDEAIVAAGSVVIQSVPDKMIVAGNPAKIVKAAEHLEGQRVENPLRF